MENEKLNAILERYEKRNKKQGKAVDIDSPYYPCVSSCTETRNVAGCTIKRILLLVDMRTQGLYNSLVTDELDPTRKDMLLLFYSCAKLTSSHDESVKLTTMLNKAFEKPLSRKSLVSIMESVDRQKEKNASAAHHLFHHPGAYIRRRESFVETLRISDEEYKVLQLDKYEVEKAAREERQEGRVDENVLIATLFLSGMKVRNIIKHTDLNRATVYRRINEMHLREIMAQGGGMEDVDLEGTKPWSRTKQKQKDSSVLDDLEFIFE